MNGFEDKAYGFTREGLATIGRNLRMAHQSPRQADFLDLLDAIDQAAVAAEPPPISKS